jgi:hypothetical protein
MLERVKRRRGGQPGNRNSAGHQNALKHGRYTAAAKAERLSWWEAFWKGEQEREAAWIVTVEPIDYAGICAELDRLRRERERDAE